FSAAGCASSRTRSASPRPGSIDAAIRGATRGLMTTLGNIAHNVATKGLRRSATHYWFRTFDIVYERRLGISTGDFSPHSAGVENLDFYRHTPTSYAEFRSLMRRVSMTPGQEVFMDYGSGLGRVLIAAAAYPFRKVIGLELLESFNRTAARNI